MQQGSLANAQFQYEPVINTGLSPTKTVTDINPEYIERIRQSMAIDKLYLNPTLTLTELAQHVAMNPKVVSQIINAGIGKSFNDFVNDYRVDEVKQRLRPSRMYSHAGYGNFHAGPKPIV